MGKIGKSKGCNTSVVLGYSFLLLLSLGVCLGEVLLGFFYIWLPVCGILDYTRVKICSEGSGGKGCRQEITPFLKSVQHSKCKANVRGCLCLQFKLPSGLYTFALTFGIWQEEVWELQ